MKKNTVYPGKRFGMLLVERYLGGYEETYLSKVHPGETRAYRNVWLCRCDCGNYKAIREDSLKSQLSRSCGCRNYKQNAGKAHKMYLEKENKNGIY